MFLQLHHQLVLEKTVQWELFALQIVNVNLIIVVDIQLIPQLYQILLAKVLSPNIQLNWLLNLQVKLQLQLIHHLL